MDIVPNRSCAELSAMAVEPVRAGQLVLVGCGRAKRPAPALAKELYNGSVFRARRRYAEGTGKRWAVLSGFYGLVSPCAVIRPYDFTIADLKTEIAREAWAMSVWRQLGAHEGATVEVHAGERYFLPLHSTKPPGIELEWPVEGLTQGALLRYYAQIEQQRAGGVLL